MSEDQIQELQDNQLKTKAKHKWLFRAWYGGTTQLCKFCLPKLSQDKTRQDRTRMAQGCPLNKKKFGWNIKVFSINQIRIKARGYSFYIWHNPNSNKVCSKTSNSSELHWLYKVQISLWNKVSFHAVWER